MQQLEEFQTHPSHLMSSNVHPSISQSIAAKLVNQVQQQIQTHIHNGNIDIPKVEAQLKLNSGKQKGQQEEAMLKLEQIQRKKENLKRQLSQIKEEEELLKNSRWDSSQNQSKYFKSELTKQDIELFRKLKEEQKKFENDLEQKTKLYELRLQKYQLQKQENKEKVRREMFDKKKEETQKMLQLIEKRKVQRATRNLEQNKQIKEIKNRKKLHEQWQSKWKSIEEEEEKKRLELKEQVKKMKQIDYDEIKTHDQKYQEAMKKNKEERLRKSMVMHQVEASYTSYKSSFLEQIQQEEENLKKNEDLKKNNPKEYWNKMKQYHEKVKQFHKPIVKVKQNNENSKSNKKQDISRSLSLLETHKKGNDYMHTVNAQVADIMKKRDPNLAISKTDDRASQKIKYKNFLLELRKTSKNENMTGSQQSMAEIRQIMKNQNLTADERVFQAQMIADKMQKKKASRSDKGIVESMNAKIQILKQMDFEN